MKHTNVNVFLNILRMELNIVILVIILVNLAKTIQINRVFHVLMIVIEFKFLMNLLACV